MFLRITSHSDALELEVVTSGDGQSIDIVQAYPSRIKYLAQFSVVCCALAMPEMAARVSLFLNVLTPGDCREEKTNCLEPT